jgi:hypothetical protein
MNPALILIGTYILVAMGLQLVGFVISQGVDQVAPSLSLFVFLGLFLCSFGLGWPIAVHNATENPEGPLKSEDQQLFEVRGLRRCENQACMRRSGPNPDRFDSG